MCEIWMLWHGPLTFSGYATDDLHVLHPIIPHRHQYSRKLNQPYSRTLRRHNSFIPYLVSKINNMKPEKKGQVAS